MGQVCKSDTLGVAIRLLLIYSKREDMLEHKLVEHILVDKLAEGEEVEYTQEVGEHNMAEDRSSYSDEYRSVDREVVVVLGDRGIRVLREVPWVPWVPYIQGCLGIHDNREVRVAPCILAVREVLAVGKVLVQVRDMVVGVGVEVVRSTLVRRLKHTWTGNHIHRD